MNLPQLCLSLLGAWLVFINGGAHAQRPEPYLVQATVTEMSLNAGSAPDVLTADGFSHALWDVTLVINKVFQGPSGLLNQEMHAFSAQTALFGNQRLVIPKLEVGDVGLWAIEPLSVGRLDELDLAHKVRENLFLPLIQGRHAEYEEVLAQWSRGEIGESKPPESSRAAGVSMPATAPAKAEEAAAKEPPPGAVLQLASSSRVDDPGAQKGPSVAWVILAVASGLGALLWIVKRRGKK